MLPLGWRLQISSDARHTGHQSVVRLRNKSEGCRPDDLEHRHRLENLIRAQSHPRLFSRCSNVHGHRPTRRIAGWKGFLQAFVNSILLHGLLSLRIRTRSLSAGSRSVGLLSFTVSLLRHVAGLAAWNEGCRRRCERRRNASTIIATPNTRAKAPSHHVSTTAPITGAMIIKNP
jgi:hypothetical protein